MAVLSNRSIDPPQERGAYSAAIFEMLGNREPLAVLADTHSQLTRAIDGLTPAQLRQPEADGKWSIAQVLRHLADSEVVWGWRMRLILSHDRPTITGFDQDLWADRLHYADSDPAEALEAFRVLRRDNIRLLERATPEDMQRVGVHAERGEESVAHLHRLYAGHDLAHLRQIDRIRQAVG